MALVALDTFRTFSGVAPEDVADVLLQSVLDGVEAGLLGALGRPHAPFQAEATNFIEIRDGTGAPWATLNYPIKGNTGVKSLVIAGVTIASTGYVYVAGGRRIVRTDGGVFGDFDEPATVIITYDTLGDEPPLAGLAVMRVASAILRQRGSEDMVSESDGPYSGTYAKAMQEDTVWQAVLHNYTWTLP